MNYYPHHLGDWLRKTADLSMTEEAAYLRLVAWYYTNEKPIPLDIAAVNKCTRAHTRGEKEAVKAILHRFFSIEADGWHNHRCDEVIAKFNRDRYGVSQTQEARRENGESKGSLVSLVNTRQRRHRERYAQLWANIQATGLPMPSDTSMKGLQAYAELHQVKGYNGVTDTVITGVTTALPARGNQEPKEISVTEVTSISAQARAEPSQAGLAVLAMKRQGVSDVNPGHPLLRQLLDAGATIETFTMAAAEANARGKGFAYALAVAKSRHTDGPARPLIGRQARDQEAMKAWAPALFPNASEAVLSPRPSDDPPALEYVP